MKILLVGMNHRTAPVEVRERFSVADPAPWLEKLLRSTELEEVVLISTCNRVEVLATARRLEGARHRLEAFFLRELGAELESPLRPEALYTHVDRDAVRHLFRVASSLDSMVVGEPQILGQVKDAYRASVETSASGAVLNRLFANAFQTAKRVRTETAIAARPVSVARVAVDLARQIFETLEGKRALLVGAGEMIELALDTLRGAGLSSVKVANRTPARALALAQRYSASPHGLSDLPELLRGSDVVLTSLAAERPLLDRALFERAMQGRREPVFAIDLGVPRNIASDVASLDGVYLYDVDDLSGVAEINAEQRQHEAARAGAIVDEAVERFDGWLAALRAAPTIRQLRERAQAVREQELDKALRKLELDEGGRRVLEALSHAIVNKILHAPVSKLRASAERDEGIAYLETIRELFALDDPTAPGAEGETEVGDPE